VNKIIHFLLTSAFALTLFACSKDDTPDQQLVTDDEAVEIVETSVSSRSGGFTEASADMAQQVPTALLGGCNQQGDTLLAHNGSNLFAAYNYSNNVSWLLTCSNLNVPQQIDFSTNATTSFDAQRWDGSGTATGNLTFSGLASLQTAYVCNGAYQYQGTVTGSVRNQNPTLTTDLDAVLTDLAIRKSDQYITGGTGNFTLTVSNGAGQSQTISGAIVFNGDGTATVTIGGKSYTITL